MTTTALAKSKQMDFNNLALMCKDLVATGSIFVGGNAISAAELAFIDGVTAGTATASKAVVLGASKDIATITSATITTLTSTTIAGTPNFSGATTFASTVDVTGVTTPTGGVAAAGGFSFAPNLCHTGGIPAQVSTDGTDATPSTTETYWAQVFVPANCSVTGAAIFNGSATGSGNITVYLSDSASGQIAASASTAISGTDAYQRVAFTGGPIAVKGPATYYVMTQYNNTASRFNTHTFGDFRAGKLTATTYGTYPPSWSIATTFTASLGPIASLY